MLIVTTIIVILVALIVFFTMIVRSISFRVGKFAQNNILVQSGVFDELILTKEQQLKGITNKISEAEAYLAELQNMDDVSLPIREYSGISIQSGAEYKNANFTDEYKELRRAFSFDKKKVLEDILSKLPEAKNIGKLGVAKKILSEIDSDTKYLLTTIPSEDQIAVLREAFTVDKNKFIDEYLLLEKKFESYEFFSYLEQYVFMNSSEIIVRTGDENDNFDDKSRNIVTQYDNSLCEGLYVLYQGMRYDFAIQNKEISG